MGKDKQLYSYVVRCDKTLVTACDFSVTLFRKMSSRHVGTSRRCYVCYAVITLEAGTANCIHCVYKKLLATIFLGMDKLLCS